MAKGVYDHHLPIEERKKKVWAALNRYGIFTEEQLDEELRTMKPLDVSCMVSPTKKKVEGSSIRYTQPKEIATDVEN